MFNCCTIVWKFHLYMILLAIWLYQKVVHPLWTWRRQRAVYTCTVKKKVKKVKIAWILDKQRLSLYWSQKFQSTSFLFKSNSSFFVLHFSLPLCALAYRWFLPNSKDCPWTELRSSNAKVDIPYTTTFDPLFAKKRGSTQLFKKHMFTTTRKEYSLKSTANLVSSVHLSLNHSNISLSELSDYIRNRRNFFSVIRWWS